MVYSHVTAQHIAAFGKGNLHAVLCRLLCVTLFGLSHVIILKRV